MQNLDTSELQLSETTGLRVTYLVAVTYPLWHLAAPDGARDPWWVWWAVAGCFATIALASILSRWVDERLQAFFPICAWLVPLHLYILASMNAMHSFYAVGSVMAVVTTVVFIRTRPALIVYIALLATLTAVLYQMEPSSTKLAYWGGILTVMPLFYLRLDGLLRSQGLSERMAEELEARVEERTRELQQSNLRLEAEIHERERLEGQLRFSHKMEVLGRVAGDLAHDFNNLLTTVNVYTEMVMDALRPADPIRADVDQIQKAVRQASSLTQKLLAFHRAGPSETGSTDLNTALRDISAMVGRTLPLNIEFECHFADQPAYVRAGLDQLGRVLMNLILNARDALPDGGRLAIAVAVGTSDGSDPATGGAGEAFVRLQVEDSGHGMDAQTRSHAFDPFFTSKSEGEGSGLGLSIVYGIVQQSGGQVRVMSEPGEGACFEIHWPLAEAAEAVRAIESPSLPRTERILLVEDEAELRHGLKRALRDGGYDVADASDGVEALRLVESAERGFDLVLSDVVMPNMNGLELAERLRDAHPDTRVLLMSAHMAPPASSGSELPPGVSFLPKPFDLGELRGKVRSVLEAPAA